MTMAWLDTDPPAGAPWWWPGEQLRLFELPPEQGELFNAAAVCGCGREPEPARPAPKRTRRRERAA